MPYTTEDGITIVYEGDTKDFDKSVSQIRKEIADLGKDVSAYNKHWKNTGNVDYLVKKLDALKERHRMIQVEILSYVKRLEYLKSLDVLSETQKKELDDLPERIRDTEGKLATCEVQIKNTQKQFEKLNKTSLEILQENLDKTGEKLTNIGDLIQRVGQSLSPISSAAANFLKEGVVSAKEYEVALANLKRTIDEDSGIDVDNLDKSIRNLAMNIPATAEEIANMVQLMAQLGVDDKGEGTMLRFAETMIALSKTTDMSAEQAAESIAKLFNIMNSDYDIIDSFSSALLTLGVSSAATESDISEMAMRIGAAGYRANMSETEVLALATALSSVGLKAQAGGSSISKIISTIDKEVALSGKNLQAWADLTGMSVEQFKQAWGESAINVIDDVITGLHNLKENGESLNVAFEDLDINEIRQIDALGRLAGKEGDLAKYLDIANESFEQNSALADATGLIYGTFDAQLQITQNKLEEFKREIGDQLVPVLREMNEMLQKVFDWFVNLSPGAKKFITVILAITSAIAPVLIAIGKVITGIGKLHFFGSQLLAQYPALEGMIGGISAGASTVVGVVAGIIAVVGLLMATSEKFRKSIMNLVKKVWDNLLKPVLDKVIELLKFIWQWIQQFVIPIIAKVGDAIAPVVDIISDLVEMIGTFLKPVIDLVVAAFEVLATLLGGTVSFVLQAIIGFIETLFGWIRDLFDKIKETEGWQKFSEGCAKVSEDLKAVIGWVQTAFDWFGNLMDRANEFLGQKSEWQTAIADNVHRYINSRTPEPRNKIFESGGFGSYNPNVVINVTNTGNTITENEVRGWASIINDELGRAI